MKSKNRSCFSNIINKPLSIFSIFFLFIVSHNAYAQSSLTYEEFNGVVAVESEHYNTKSDNGTPRRWYETTSSVTPNVSPDPDPNHVSDAQGNASGSAYMEVLPDTRVTHDDPIKVGVSIFPDAGTGPKLNFKVKFNTTGTYYVWARVFSTGPEDNGMHVGINGSFTESGARLQWCAGKDEWTWSNSQRSSGATNHCGNNPRLYITINVKTAGVHTISFTSREDGLEMDKWAMTKRRIETAREFESLFTQNGPKEVVDGGSPPPPATNQPPAITSSPVLNAVANSSYKYDVNASDPNDANSSLTFSLDNAPAGMTINSGSGVINWTPGDNQTGGNNVTVRVTDPGGLTDTQGFTVDVAAAGSTPPPPSSNVAPTITSKPASLNAVVGIEYMYDVNATDANDPADSLVYSLENKPAGMTIDPATGFISWMPTDNQVGSNFSIVRVTDPGGLIDRQSFSIEVAPAGSTPPPAPSPSPSPSPSPAPAPDPAPAPTNEAPSITTKPASVSGIAGIEYLYDVNATDPNDPANSLVYSLENKPAGMTIDPATGVISWIPTDNQIGSNFSIVRVTDPGGLVDRQSFSVEVASSGASPANEAPGITTKPASTTGTTAVEYIYDVDATDPNDPVNSLVFLLESSPTGMTIDTATGLISWTPADSQTGIYVSVVRVTDPGGLFDRQSFAIDVTSAGSTPPPPAANNPPAITSSPVTSVTDGDLYTYDVVAMDLDLANGDVLSFSLETAPAGMSIDALTGLISWVPGNQTGIHAVTVKVTDSGMLIDMQDFNIEVLEPAAPITSELRYSLNSDRSSDLALLDEIVMEDIYIFLQDDPGITQVRFLLDGIEQTVDTELPWDFANGTVGMANGFDTTMIPNGAHTITAELNGGTEMISASFMVDNVGGPNTGPSITSEPVANGTNGSLYSYNIEAVDADLNNGDSLVFALLTAPDGMVINPTSGNISWMPDGQSGLHAVKISVTDSGMLSDEQGFLIAVSTQDTNFPPTIPTLVSPANGAGSADNLPAVGSNVTFAWQASTDTDTDDSISYQLIYCEGTDITQCAASTDVASLDTSAKSMMAGISGLGGILIVGFMASGWSRRRTVMAAIVIVIITTLTACSSDNNSSPTQLPINTDETTFTVNNLTPGSTYVWQVIATDKIATGTKGGLSASEVRTFTVAP